MKKSDTKKIIQNIFQEIDDGIESTRSDWPVTIEDSKFLEKYNEIKERYLNEKRGRKISKE